MKSAELNAIVKYLSLASVADHVNAETGAESNERLRRIFMELLDTLKPDVFLDIGARDGESAAAVKREFPHCDCHAFEASPVIYQRFAAEVEANGSFAYHHLAMSDRHGSTELYIPRKSTEVVVGDEIVAADYEEDADTGRSSLLRRTDPGAEYDVVEVSTTTLDRFSRTQSWARDACIAVWIDVEGAASRVVAGGLKTLARAAIVFIEVEGHAFWEQQRTSTDVVSQLIDLGFVPIARDREYYDKQFNIVLVRTDLLSTCLPPLFDRRSSLREARDSTASLENRVAALEGRRHSVYPPVVGRFTPVFIPTFNNPTFLLSMLKQLEDAHHRNIVVLDNASTYPPMLELLDRIGDRTTVRRFPDNAGPRRIWEDRALWDGLPQVFAVTDPDLRLSTSLPADFIEQLYEIGRRHEVGKAGFALDISRQEEMVADDFVIDGRPHKVWEWERQFWRNELEPGVYRALIDTTFAVYNKQYFTFEEPLAAVRVSGDFTATHLPWLRDFRLPPEETDYYRVTNRHSFYLPNTEHGPPSA